MERIGIAASKIAKGNLLLYNFFVLFIALLCSLLLFFISGTFIIIAVVIIAVLKSIGSFPDLNQWMPIMVMILNALAVVIGVLTLYAIFKNVKLFKK